MAYCSPAVWRQEIRELASLPIRTQSDNVPRLLINPPPFPHKTSLVTSLSAKTSLLFNEGTRDSKSRTEKQRTRGGEIQEEMKEQDTIDQYILTALFLPVPIKDKTASQAPLARPLFHYSLKCPLYLKGRSLTYSSDKAAAREHSRMTGHCKGLWWRRCVSK